MIKYILAQNTGKGFITHDDQEIDGLKFKCISNLTIIQGYIEKINNWVSRVSGQEITEQEGLDLKKSIEIKGLEDGIIITEQELITLNQKLDEKKI